MFDINNTAIAITKKAFTRFIIIHLLMNIYQICISSFAPKQARTLATAHFIWTISLKRSRPNSSAV